MNFGYKKRHMNINLIFGLIWFVWFFVGILSKDVLTGIDYGWIFISAMYLIRYYHQRQKKYITIADGVIKDNDWFGKKLLISEIVQVKEFAGNYIIKTDKKELVINTDILDPKSLPDLIEELKKFNVEWVNNTSL